MGHGWPPVMKAYEHGLRPSLSIDVVTTVPGDMFTQMRCAFGCERARPLGVFWKADQPAENLLTEERLLEMATIDGAHVAGLEDRIGSLTPGKKADVVVIDATAINVAPVMDPVAAVALPADVSNVETVIIDGRVQKRDGKLVADVAKARRLVEESRDYLLEQRRGQGGVRRSGVGSGPAGTLRAVERESQLPGHFGDVGEQLREERQRQGISQRELAARLGLSPSLISQIETGRSKPSVSTLYAIVTELHLSLDRLFRGTDDDTGSGRAAPESAPGPGVGRGTVVHPEDRHVIELESGVRWERLTGYPEDEVDFMYVVYDVGGASAGNATLMRHSGKEYGYVISGRLGLQIGFRSHTLGPGDSIAFNSTQPHRLWTIGDEPVHAIWCVVGREE